GSDDMVWSHARKSAGSSAESSFFSRSRWTCDEAAVNPNKVGVWASPACVARPHNKPTASTRPAVRIIRFVKREIPVPICPSPSTPFLEPKVTGQDTRCITLMHQSMYRHRAFGTHISQHT